MSEHKTIGSFMFYIGLSVLIAGFLAIFVFVLGPTSTGAVILNADSHLSHAYSITNIIGSVLVGVLFFATILGVSHVSTGMYGNSTVKSSHNSKYHKVVETIKKNDKLADYVLSCRKHGMNDHEISAKCVSVGWKQEQINEAFRRV